MFSSQKHTGGAPLRDFLLVQHYFFYAVDFDKISSLHPMISIHMLLCNCVCMCGSVLINTLSSVCWSVFDTVTLSIFLSAFVYLTTLVRMYGARFFPIQRAG